jgi:3'(2'), 5'-bisphosphate nucleotidase
MNGADASPDPHLMITAVGAALEAGHAIQKIYHSEFSVDFKEDRSPLTQADREAHQVISMALAPLNIPILSEEGRHIPYEERTVWDRFWLVDPLDGTKEFIKRNGEFTVNIALLIKNRPCLGVVYVPEKDTLYFAADALGAYKVDRVSRAEGYQTDPLDAPDDARSLLARWTRSAASLPVSSIRAERFTIVGSRSHSTPELMAFVEQQKKAYGQVDFISAGSSLKFCMVAEGRAMVYPRLGPTMEWDTAAGQAIAEGAGCRVYRYDTRAPLNYNKKNLLNPFFVVERP